MPNAGWGPEARFEDRLGVNKSGTVDQSLSLVSEKIRITASVICFPFEGPLLGTREGGCQEYHGIDAQVRVGISLAPVSLLSQS